MIRLKFYVKDVPACVSAEITETFEEKNFDDDIVKSIITNERGTL